MNVGSFEQNVSYLFFPRRQLNNWFWSVTLEYGNKQTEWITRKNLKSRHFDYIAFILLHDVISMV